MRQSGKTTSQMLDAPQEAIYIWCNTRLLYPKNLAKFLGRRDLEIVSISVLDDTERVARGRVFSGIVLDHASRLTDRQRDGYHLLCLRSGEKLTGRKVEDG